MTHGHFAVQKVVACLLLGLLVTKEISASDGPARITVQPAKQTILQGTPVTFSVEVDGTPPFSFQWLRNGAIIDDGTNQSYAIPFTTASDNLVNFSVAVSNALGSVLSTTALLRVDPGMVVATQTFTNFLTFTNAWRYDASGRDLGTAWRAADFDDSSWSNGFGAFDGKNDGYRTNGLNGVPILTRLPTNGVSGKITTYYFRTHFNFTNYNAATVQFNGRMLLDDGAIFYLNGNEILAQDVNSGASYSDFATYTVGDAAVSNHTMAATGILIGDNVLAAEGHQVNAGSSDITFGLALDAIIGIRGPDTVAPVITSELPIRNSTLRNLNRIEIFFSEPVEGVDAQDLLINGSPATSIDVITENQYIFYFPPTPTGMVQIAWSPTHGIHDVSVNQNPFVADIWNYLVDPNAVPAAVFISEFLAQNSNGIRDEDGDHSDWIELYNASSDSVNLNGWHLTDTAINLSQWTFPNVTMLPNSYLLVFASGKNRTNATGRLHTNFQLARSGEYLALVDAAGFVVSEFAPAFPSQYPDISYGRDRQNPSITGFFTTPSPGAANATSGPGFAPEVHYSRTSGTFIQPFNLELSATGTNVEIRYTLITNAASAILTNVPSTNSTLYTGPLTISNAVQVRARAFQPGLFAGPPGTEVFIPITPGVATNSSDLPIVLFYNFGAGNPPATEQAAFMAVFEPLQGRTWLTNPPTTYSRINFHRRGSSTLNQTKPNLAVEFWDEYNEEKDLKLLGMPADSDWVFYACDNFEPIFIHNPYMHQLSRDVGRYSPRCQMVEVYLNTAGGSVSAPNGNSADYYGIYVIEEKIKVGKHRVDINKLQLENTNAPSVTGGYLLKVDRATGDDYTVTGGNQAMVYVSPDGQEVRNGLRRAQNTYIAQYFNNFYSVLKGPNWTNPVTGYAAWIDVDSWIDHHLLNTLCFNIDAMRLSAYLYKPRNERINMGPLWDYDRTLGSTDGRDFNPRRWRSVNPDYGTDMFHPGSSISFSNWWYSVLFTDIDFWQRYIDRYQELRRTQFSTNWLHALVDSLANQVREGQVRERTRWGTWNSPRNGTVTVDGYSNSFNGTFQGEVDFMKKWLTDRVSFMDNNFLPPPCFVTEGGLVSVGSSVAILAPGLLPNTTIYYTLDGTDPRAWNSGGQPSSNALMYTGPIMLSNNVHLVARAFNLSHVQLTDAVSGGTNNPPLASYWSGPVHGYYHLSIPPLRITEIMYHPTPPPIWITNDTEDFEYIEVQNISSNALNLANFTVSGGIHFTFTNFVLGAGQRAVIVPSTEAFISRYGSGIPIAGQYTNRLDNGGERLVLQGPMGESILDFKYDDQWYLVTDGFGFSLVLLNPAAAPSTWGLKQSWRPSGAINGSPGTPDPEPPTVPTVYVNEVLTHTDLPALDALELYNPNNDPVDVGGWFLTDDFRTYGKFHIPTNSVIPAHGYIVFDENDFNTGPNAFALSSTGDEIYLFSADADGYLTGFVNGFDFGPAANGVTFGRYVTSTGEEHEPAQSVPTLGNANAGPKVGPVVISEIMYHPPDVIAATLSYDDTFNEFIELYNITDQPVLLYDPAYPTNTWHLKDAVDYIFPTNTTLPPYTYCVIVSFDPADPVKLSAFRARYAPYGLGTNVLIFGPYDGKLQNDEEGVELARPDTPEPPGVPDAGFVPYILVDKVKYSDQTPWPVGADGLGQSLQRLNTSAYGNDPINWLAAAPTPGAGYIASGGPNIIQQPASQTVQAGSSVMLVVGANGGSLRYQWRRNGDNIPGATNYSLAMPNVQVALSGQYQCLVMNAAGSVLTSVATLNVLFAPGFYASPQAQDAWGSTNVQDYGIVPTNVMFSCIATGSLPLVYQWRLNGANIPGATNANLILANASHAQDGNYSVVVSNLSGSAVSADAAFSVLMPTLFLEQPQSTNVIRGNTVSFKVRVQGRPPPFGYIWQRSGVTVSNIISTDTNSVLTLTSVQTNDSGLYTVTVTNKASPLGVTSAAASLLVIQAPVITSGPSNLTVTSGQTVTFTVSATGTGPFRYQWKYKGADMPGQTNATLVIPNVQPSDEGTYKVSVANAAGNVSSLAATLTVIVAPRLTQPQLLPGHSFRAFLSGKTNNTYTLEYSTNLTNWSNLSTLVYTNGQMPFTDNSATNSQRFYRANGP